MKAYKKSMWVVAASAALAGTFVWNAVSVGVPTPGPKQNVQMGKDAASALTASPGSVQVGANICTTTGFEAVEADCGWEAGWICGSTFTNCTGPIAGSCTGNDLVDGDCCISNPNPMNGWYVSGSNQHCNQPHVSTMNPSASAGGTQHLRFERDSAGGNPAGCTGGPGVAGCRVNAFTPTVGLSIPAPVSISFDLAQSAPYGTTGLKGNFWYTTVDDGASFNNFWFFHYYGLWFVYDYAILDYGFGGYVNGVNTYAKYRMEWTPCPDEPLVDCNPDGMPPVYTGCPIRYYVDYYDGAGEQLTYGSAVTAGSRVSRSLLFYDNIAGNSYDLDNHAVVYGANCPSECGNAVVEPGEQCEAGVAGPCPQGRCDANCQCTPICTAAEPCTLVNGDNGPFIAPFDPAFGGIWHYDGDAPNLAYDMCGSAGVDTLIRVFDDLALLAQNDDCCDPADGNCGGFGNGSTPNASCYGPEGYSPPYPSCTCAPNTNPAYGHDVQLARISPVGASIRIHVNKKSVCGGEFVGSCCIPEAESCTDNVLQSACTGNWSGDLKCADIVCALPRGACCILATETCTDDVLEADCTGTWTDGALCADVNCTLPRGACCNRAPGAGGACQENLTDAECNFEWTEGGTCASVNCAEVTGACCNRLLGSCNSTIQGACNCADCVWTQGAACGSVPCAAIQGACCVVDGQDATCTQESQAGCDALGGEWTRETDCANVTCEPSFVPIPTVSEWGLVIMALLLLVGGKVYFGRRQVATA